MRTADITCREKALHLFSRQEGFHQMFSDKWKMQQHFLTQQSRCPFLNKSIHR